MSRFANQPTSPALDVEAPLDDASGLLRERYGTAASFAPERWNAILSTLAAHRSVRAYLPTALPPDTLDLMIAAAQSASTSSNLQTWSVIAVEDPDRKARLSEMAGSQKHIRDCPLFLVWLADLARIDRVAGEHDVAVAGLDYLEMLIVGIVDAALAAQNAVIAAESLGLGTVYIGGIRNKPEEVAAELGLPSRVMPVFGLCVGYPDPADPASVKPRLPRTAVLHRERYSWDDQRPAIEAYDATLRDFFKGQGMETAPWTDTVIKRVRTPQALTGRDRIKEALGNLGFVLK
ncbi:MAG TPA: NADPH-dependent oxidoreductase [Stellaceae bacterium]|nr:NADPH-dependent oxidoreductase [Stellaceae bacterium]